MDYLIAAYSVLCKAQTESWDTGWINFDLQRLKRGMLNSYDELNKIWKFVPFLLGLLPQVCRKICKVKSYHYRPGVAQRVPGGLGSQIFMTFGTWRW